VKAASLLAKALEIDPLNPTAHANLSLLYMGQGQYDSALVHSMLAIDMGMRQPTLIKNSGYAFLALGKELSAIELFSTYLQLVPDDQKVRDVLQQLEQRSKNDGDANPN